jgi:hypothetical protein
MSLCEYGRLRWKLKVIVWKQGVRKWMRDYRRPSRMERLERLEREEQMEFGW